MNQLFNKLQAINKIKNVKLIIERDEKVGFYLFVYDLTSGRCIKDFLYFPEQLDYLYNHAKIDYDVNKEDFYQIENNDK